MPEEPVNLKITTRGVLALWGATLLLLLGILQIDGVLVMLSLLLVLAVLGARGWARRNLADLDVVRELPLTAWAGSTVDVPFAISNHRQWLDAFDLVLRGQGPESALKYLALGAVGAGGFIGISGRLRVPPRGRHRGGEWELCSTFPGGLFEGKRRGTFDDQWMVYPSPVLPSELQRVVERAKLEQLMKWRLQNEGGDEFRGIRDYQSGDAIKAIHWAASARAGRMMARQWDPPEPMEGRVGIVVHSVSVAKRMIRPAAFEAALKAASGLVRYFRNEGVRVNFSAAFDDWQLRQAPDRGRYSEIFEALAGSRRRVEASSAKLQATVNAMARNCERVFVIGDGPLREWSDFLDSGDRAAETICISGESVRVCPPKLRMKSLAVGRSETQSKGARR
jgi:uncharacterized protein (DUF58 family)